MKSLLIAALLAFLGAPVAAPAQYPTKPIKLIVAFPPGGPTDIVARLIAQKLSDALGQRMIVENRPGAGGTLGAEAAAKSASDGYTLLLGTTGTLASAPSLYPALPYDPVKSFVPISRVINAPFLVVVSAALPVNSLRDLVELARSEPGRLSYGSAGVGSPAHIAGEMFKTAAGVDVTHIPYKGTGPALTDLLPGRIDVMFDVPAALLSHVRSEKLRVLAVAGPKRLAQLPDVPTTAEAGLPGYEVNVWFGLVAPSGTSSDIVRRLNAEVLKALAGRQVRDALVQEGFEPSGSSPAEFADLIRTDNAKWTRAVKASGARLE